MRSHLHRVVAFVVTKRVRYKGRVENSPFVRIRVRVSVDATPVVLSTQLHPSHVFDAHGYVYTNAGRQGATRGNKGGRAGAVRRHRRRSITRRELVCVCTHRRGAARGGAGRSGERMAEKGRRRWTVKRHHKSLPAVSPVSNRILALPLPPPPPAAAGPPTGLSSTLRNSNGFPPPTTSRAIRPWP